jgi:hypothetical protein
MTKLLKSSAVVVTLCSLLLSSALTAQVTQEEPSFSVAVLKADGSPLLAQEKENVKLTSRTEGKKTFYRIESPLLKTGAVSVGFQFPKERHLLAAKIEGSRVSFNDKEKTSVSWTGNALLVSPKPKKKLDILLAEYGASGKWLDITALVKKSQIGDSLKFSPTNAAVGKDPIGGVVKSMMLTYSLSDADNEEETLKECRENSLVQIQFDEKEQYFRFVIKDTEVFEFSVVN